MLRLLVRAGCIGQNFYRKAVEEARSALPTIALGTDLTAGFPGEFTT